MTTTALILTLVVVTIGAFLLSLLARTRSVWADLRAEGFQENEIVVKGRYLPDVIRVKRGIPVRLHFRRDEANPCSERVIFSDFHVGALLPAYQTTTLSFIPTRSGEFLFTCALGMYQGRLVVVEPTNRDLAKIRAAGPIIADNVGRLEDGDGHFRAISCLLELLSRSFPVAGLDPDPRDR